MEIEVKAADLNGDALDYMVAQVEKPPHLMCFNSVDGGPRSRGNLPRYSTDWSECEKLAQKYISEIYSCRFGTWEADGWPGDTIPIAICRAVVGERIGGIVKIPDWFVTG